MTSPSGNRDAAPAAARFHTLGGCGRREQQQPSPHVHGCWPVRPPTRLRRHRNDWSTCPHPRSRPCAIRLHRSAEATGTPRPAARTPASRWSRPRKTRQPVRRNSRSSCPPRQPARRPWRKPRPAMRSWSSAAVRERRRTARPSTPAARRALPAVAAVALPPPLQVRVAGPPTRIASDGQGFPRRVTLRLRATLRVRSGDARTPTEMRASASNPRAHGREAPPSSAHVRLAPRRSTVSDDGAPVTTAPGHAAPPTSISCPRPSCRTTRAG